MYVSIPIARALRVVHDAFGAVEVGALAAARDGASRRRCLRTGHFARLLGRRTATAGRGGPHEAVHALEPRLGPWRASAEPIPTRCVAERAAVRAVLAVPYGARGVAGASDLGHRHYKSDP